MMSHAAIRRMNEEATERARAARNTPLLIEDEDDIERLRDGISTIPRVDPDVLHDEYDRIPPEDVLGDHRAINSLPGPTTVRVEAGAMGVTMPTMKLSEFLDRMQTGYAYGVVHGDPASAGIAIFEPKD